jgi:hypothetical protein
MLYVPSFAYDERLGRKLAGVSSVRAFSITGLSGCVRVELPTAV